MEDSERVVQLVPLLRLRHLGNRRFDYTVPAELAGEVSLGSVVSVPFGTRSVRAVVVALGPSAGADPDKIRNIEQVANERVSPELLVLAASLAERYLSPFEACLRLVAPPSITFGAASAQRRPLRWVRRASGSGPEIRLTAKQLRVCEVLPPEGASPIWLCEHAGVGRAVLRTLLDKGVLAAVDPLENDGGGAGSAASVAMEKRPVPEMASTAAISTGGWRLSPEQDAAVRTLTAAYRSEREEHRLLWGVTGSGKTEVYLRLLAEVLAEGGGAILLVPEIALTPQMIARVKDRFGPRVGVLHSGLSHGERASEYRRIVAGTARVVVGARSAVFAPVPGLRLVILDEAHDSSYKQEEEPRYRVRTVAWMRISGTKGLLLEGSATPSVESLRSDADQVRLSTRVAGELPQPETVDMRRQGGEQLLAAVSREALATVLRRGEQAIVLLNRRGYAGYVHCEACGHVMTCTDCELSLTYHSKERLLLCHHCGRSYPQPARCPACEQGPLTRAVPGTERLDQELRNLVPDERVFRLDSDVLTSGSRVRALLDAFALSSPGVLVGTQMVAKGHDFPNVTLVLVADADTGLYVPDFRAAERTFQLLTQVAGRAGRGLQPGRVLVQTWNPDVPCIRMALDRDELGFYQEELRIRERLGYPPFAELTRLLVASPDGGRAMAAAQHLSRQLAPHFPRQELCGPVRLPSLRGQVRWHIIVAARDGDRARGVLRQALEQLAEPYRRRGVRLLVDVDPEAFG
ncbi:MAG TPA: primosomal protein N' [Thermoleophilia bacterium]